MLAPTLKLLEVGDFRRQLSNKDLLNIRYPAFFTFLQRILKWALTRQTNAMEITYRLGGCKTSSAHLYAGANTMLFSRINGVEQ